MYDKVVCSHVKCSCSLCSVLRQLHRLHIDQIATGKARENTNLDAADMSTMTEFGLTICPQDFARFCKRDPQLVLLRGTLLLKKRQEENGVNAKWICVTQNPQMSFVFKDVMVVLEAIFKGNLARSESFQKCFFTIYIAVASRQL